MTDSLSLKRRELHEGTQSIATIVNLETRLAALEAGATIASGSTLPATATKIGDLFIRTGVTSPGLYLALDLVGNWSGPK